MEATLATLAAMNQRPTRERVSAPEVRRSRSPPEDRDDRHDERVRRGRGRNDDPVRRRDDREDPSRRRDQWRDDRDEDPSRRDQWREDRDDDPSHWRGNSRGRGGYWGRRRRGRGSGH